MPEPAPVNKPAENVTMPIVIANGARQSAASLLILWEFSWLVGWLVDCTDKLVGWLVGLVAPLVWLVAQMV